MTDFENNEMNQQPVAPAAPEVPAVPEVPVMEIPEVKPVEDPFTAPAPEAPFFQQPQAPAQPQQPQYTAPQYTAPQPPQPVQQQPQYNQGYYQQPQQQQKTLYNTPPAGYPQKSRLAAGLLGILLGAFGVHNFYLGYKTRAIIQLVVSLAGGIITCGAATFGIWIWAFIEGIQILTANSPARFYDGNGVILKD